jgi:DNA primase
MTRYVGVDLVSLIELKAGISLVKRSNHFKFGNEFWGPCPFCKGGENRFHVWLEGRVHYWCRVCNREGSPAKFLMEYENLSFPEALEALGIPDSDEEHEYVPPTLNEQLARGNPPSKRWQEAAWILIERAERYLWHPKSLEGQQALAYLRARGLTDATIKKARLGYVPLGRDGRWYVGDFEAWGVDPDQLREDQRAKGGVRVPDGILIPWTEGRTVWKLCLKRPGQVMSYGQVLGSSDGGLYNIDTVTADQPAMMVESELCALSILQEAGDICNVVATGSTPKGRNSRHASDLVAASCILQSFDADEAGDEASEYWVSRFKEKCIRWRPWADEETGRFKDPNEILQYQEAFKVFTGYTLRGWVEVGITTAELPTPPEGPDDFPESTQEHVVPPDVTPSEWRENSHSDESERLEQFAGVVSQIVDIFGGPEQVSIARHNGQTLEERARELREPYSPLTLSPLPRKQCPHLQKNTPCKGKPLEHGWCAEHARSHELLCLMAEVGFPEVELTFQTGYRDGKPVMGSRVIGKGVASCEAYAEVAPEKWLVRDISRIRAKFGLLRLVS